MMNNNIAVVGGGITGLLTSAALAQRGHRVTVYEADNTLGGVLRDIVIGGERYYRGCQYLPENPEWYAQLGLSSALNNFKDEHNTYTNLGTGPAALFEGFAQPVFGGVHEFSTPDILPDKALDCLRLYGDLGTRLIEYAAGFNINDGLHRSNLNAMQLDRIYLPDMHDGVCKMKQDSAVLDEILGVPRRLRNPDSQTAFAALPSQGYDGLIAEIYDKLVGLGVDCRLSSPVTPYVADDGTVKFRVRKTELTHDLTVWCGNPTSLIHALSGRRLGAGPVETTTLFGELSNWCSQEPVYWQIFDSSKHLFRQFVWSDNGKIKFAAEAKRAEPGKILKDITEFSALVVPDAEICAKGHIDERRWINTSVADFELIAELAPKMLENKIVPGAWEVFARERKLDKISQTLSDLGWL